ncbi:MAG: ATP-binding protein, partial [Methanobacteriaceae archaeon]
GLRGAGKTTLIFQLYNYLVNDRNISPKRVLYISLERLKDLPGISLKDILDYFIENIHNAYPLVKEKLFIFVDESHYDSDWSLTAKKIHDTDKNIFLIFTGSSTMNLELNVDTARRAIRKSIHPLNFEDYLLLKYNLPIPKKLKNLVLDLIFNADSSRSVNKSSKTDNNMHIGGHSDIKLISEINSIENSVHYEVASKLNFNLDNLWKNYLKYGSLPLGINEDFDYVISQNISMKDKVIEKDMDFVSSSSLSTKLSAYKILNILATQTPGSTSVNSISNDLGISNGVVSKILSLFEKTSLIFPIKAYGSPTKRERKSWKYYFYASSLKYSIFSNTGILRSSNQLLGMLSENLVASLLFQLNKNQSFNIFYDSNKNGVDFLLNTINGKIIPIEVGIGNKNKKQVKIAINKYNSDYGIILTDNVFKTVKDDNIIYMPLKTFSFI